MIDGNFTLIEPNGATPLCANISNIILADSTTNTTYPVFTNENQFWTELTNLGYFDFLNQTDQLKEINEGIDSIITLLSETTTEPPTTDPIDPPINNISFETQDTLNITQLNVPHVMWTKFYNKSSFPSIITPKPYIVTYSTDHAEGAYGAGGLYLGIADDLQGANFEYIGRMYGGYQAETPYLIEVNGLVHLYYHTNASDPQHIGSQQTHLRTTLGGDIHNLTWTEQSLPMSLLANENHLGYLKTYPFNGVYKGIHITRGGIPQNYSFSTSVDGFNFTRDDVFNRTAGLSTGFQYKGTTGTFIQNLYGYNWAILNVVPENFQGNTTFGLVRLDENLQPVEYCRDLHDGDGIPIVINKAKGDIEVLVEDNIANIYWTEGDIVRMKRYDLMDVQNYVPLPVTPDLLPTYPSNTISAYNLNENVNDQVSNNNGTPTNTTYQLVDSSNYAGVFNGNASVIVQESGDFEINNLGVELMIKTADAGSNLRALVVKQFAFGIFIHNGVLKMYDWSDTGGFKDTAVNVTDDIWHKINVEFRNGIENETIVYVDDVEVLTTTYNFKNQTKKLVIGNGDDGTITPPSGQHFNGMIENVRIYTL